MTPEAFKARLDAERAAGLKGALKDLGFDKAEDAKARFESLKKLEDAQKTAEDEGCSDQLDDVYGCYGDQLECRESELDLDGCDSEEEALSECMGNRSLRGPIGSVNACGQIKACCVAQTEIVEGADVSVCDIYDEASEDACAAALDVARGYEYPEGAQIPSECRF